MSNMTIREILLQYSAELRHGLNELNGHGTALEQATQAITQAMLDIVGEDEKLPSGDNVNGMKSIHRRKRNQLRAEIRTAIKGGV